MYDSRPLLCSAVVICQIIRQSMLLVEGGGCIMPHTHVHTYTDSPDSGTCSMKNSAVPDESSDKQPKIKPSVVKCLKFPQEKLSVISEVDEGNDSQTWKRKVVQY